MTYELLRPHLVRPLTELFEALRKAGEERWFHPHPLTVREAERLCRYAGRDVYSALVEDGCVVAYGMLRGWDDGYEIPSLGLAVHPGERRRGLGRALMGHLHEEARRRGAARVRLTVEPGNESARRLYDELGYEFEQCGGVLVGFLAL